VEEGEGKTFDGSGLADAASPYWEEVRRLMVERQIEARGVSDPRVLEAMRLVPRHVFVPLDLRGAAYDDRPLDIGHGQTISQPYIVAYMTEQLYLRPGDRVLDVGTGSGYQAAILGLLARQVLSIERWEPLARAAEQRLRALGSSNIDVIVGDGTLGYLAGAPYDAILVAAAAPRVPKGLVEQLSVGGRLLCPVGPHESQSLVRVTRTETGYRTEEGIHCMFVPLIGEQGWPQS